MEESYYIWPYCYAGVYRLLLCHGRLLRDEGLSLKVVINTLCWIERRILFSEVTDVWQGTGENKWRE